ncbi:gliding motility-associated C-terminal domain-containing protein [Flavisolibacter tropicus]|nr:gliding motility-associated C-terminal domain-containing protein [Flavisolibacter tropicus]
MTRLPFLFFIFFLICFSSSAQNCTTIGQNPSTAFPVCGTTTFVQNTVPLCTNANVPVKPGECDFLPAKNPFWYKFTCYQDGDLGFLIVPSNPGDDYDWQLFDITNRDPNDVFRDASLLVIANWAGTPGNTGASDAGVSYIQCGSDPAANKPTFTKKPQLKKDHVYLLLISHFDNTQSGYSLSFGGGTAVITDPNIPKLKALDANCDGDVIRVKLNKPIRCNSIAADGSDFILNIPGITVTKATGIGCSQQFDTDSIQLQLSAPLAPGVYTVSAKKGTDNNTLLDNCGNPVPEGDVQPVTIIPKTPTPMDQLGALACAPKQIKVSFKREMLCSSIASNGSDFFITGPYPVTVTGATGGTCTNGLTKEIVVTLATPLQAAGNFQLNLRKGSDGNSVINECLVETLPGSLPFSVTDTVNADFTYIINYGCTEDKVSYSHHGKDGVNYWEWKLDEGQESNSQNTQANYTIFNEKQVQLVVSNGVCNDTTTQKIQLLNALKADFTVIDENCPNEPIQFTSQSIGHQLTYNWNFDDGNQATTENPKHTYAIPGRETVYNVNYTITDLWGCQQSVQKPIKIYTSCYIAVPNAFTPNGDGKNETIGPLNAIKAEQVEFAVYNRWGQLVYKTQNWKNGWDGKLNGKLQPASVYIWTLSYVNRDTKQKVQNKGTFVLIR